MLEICQKKISNTVIMLKINHCDLSTNFNVVTACPESEQVSSERRSDQPEKMVIYRPVLILQPF